MLTNRFTSLTVSSLVVWLLAAGLAGQGCRSSQFKPAADAAVAEDSGIDSDAQAPPSDFGAACQVTDDCTTAGLVCAHPLGASQPGICSVVDCRGRGCPWGATCLVWRSLAVTKNPLKKTGFLPDFIPAIRLRL